MSKYMPLLLFVIAGVVIAGAIYWIERTKPRRAGTAGTGENVAINVSLDGSEKARRYERAKKIVAPAGFINTPGITIEELIGKKVILVDFWTYSCINCQRTLPYLTAWYDKYRDQGLEIVGVHTPEFEFEKKLENVQWAVDKYRIEYPVVLDNDYGTWQAYRNRYWPRKYLIDIDGYIVYDHIGEGAYEETEQKIQMLLRERMERLGEQGNVATDIVTPTNTDAVTDARPRSPEIYFGSSRNVYLGNGKDGVEGVQAFVEPTGIKTNILYLVGTWDIRPEFSQNTARGAKIIYRYQGAKVFMVARADKPVRVTVRRDGELLTDAAGRDVRNGELTINEDRLYYIVDDPSGWGEHTLEIIINDADAQLFTFTFG